MFAGGGPATGLCSQRTLPSPQTPGHHRVMAADTGRRPTGGGSGDQRLIRMEVAEVTREPIDVRQDGPTPEACDPLPCDLASQV